MIPALVFVSIALVGIFLGMAFIHRKMDLAGKHWLDLLRAYPDISGKAGECPVDVQFQYSDAQDKNLKTLRKTYGLDAIAGDGPEVERLINLMKWVNHLTWHHPNPKIPGPYNALRLIALSKGYRRGINCWMFALILNEVYLSMGYASRLMHLMPHSNEGRESHYAVAVYSHEAGRWLYMDPDFCGYFMDERGNILGIPEIRRRLVNRELLVVNRDVRGFTALLGKSSYPWYVSKNIFQYACAQRSEFDQETDCLNRVNFALIPYGYREELLIEPEISDSRTRNVYLNDEELFWQKP